MDIALPIFPEGSLVSSVVTTTWVGVFVVAFFNLRFGWVLSGLVVPGYLVPLIIVRPWSAAVIVVEGIAVYLIVWLFSEVAPRFAPWSAVFGRDRFFALVLASIGVRVGFDLYLLPWVGETVNRAFGLSFDYADALHSFGLIIISLVANLFWKTGLWRGLPPLLINLAVTWAVVRFVLIEFTNFRISTLAYLYEDVAASVLAAPQAYIVLVSTAFIASRLNLRYGWDFNGILIPALIALQWFEPMRILTSFAEALVVLGLGMLVLRTPIFANVTVEGARKVLLFFNIAFAYKMALGHLIPLVAPAVKVTDFFGFGYLLSTLIAIKMHDKAIVARLTRATLQASLTGAAAAVVIGFGLSLLPRAGPARAPAPAAQAPAVASLREVFDEAVIQVFSGRVEAPGDISLAGLRNAPLIEGRYRVLRSGGSLAVIDTGAPAGLVITVPDPLHTPGLADAAMGLFEASAAHALILGLPRERVAGAFREQLVVRGGPESRLQLSGRPPRGLDLAALERLTGGFAVTWGKAGNELVLDEQAQRSLVVRTVAAEPSSATAVAPYPNLETWLAPAQLPPPAEGLLRPEELLYLDEAVITPLVHLAQRWTGHWNERAVDTLAGADRAARPLGYRVGHIQNGRHTLVTLDPDSRDRGRYALRLGSAERFLIQVPRLSERGTDSFAAGLFERGKARALMLAPASGAPDVLEPRHRGTLFTLISQVLMREAADAPMMLVQVRGRGAAPEAASGPDVLVAFGSGARVEPMLAPLESRLLGLLGGSRTVGLAGGEAAAAGYGAGEPPQATYFALSRNKSLAVLWLPPDVRAEFAQRDLDGSEAAQFAALGLAVSTGELAERVRAGTAAADIPAEVRALWAEYVASRDVVALRGLQKAAEQAGLRLEMLIQGEDRFLLFTKPDGALAIVGNLWPAEPDRVVLRDLAEFDRSKAGWLVFGEVAR